MFYVRYRDKGLCAQREESECGAFSDVSDVGKDTRGRREFLGGDLELISVRDRAIDRRLAVPAAHPCSSKGGQGCNLQGPRQLFPTMQATHVTFSIVVSINMPNGEKVADMIGQTVWTFGSIGILMGVLPSSDLRHFTVSTLQNLHKGDRPSQRTIEFIHIYARRRGCSYGPMENRRAALPRNRRCVFIVKS